MQYFLNHGNLCPCWIIDLTNTCMLLVHDCLHYILISNLQLHKVYRTEQHTLPLVCPICDFLHSEHQIMLSITWLWSRDFTQHHKFYARGYSDILYGINSMIDITGCCTCILNMHFPKSHGNYHVLLLNSTLILCAHFTGFPILGIEYTALFET